MTTTSNVSVLATLRALIPRRRLTHSEARQRVELQANRFRELTGHSEAELPEAVIAALPRLLITREFDLPASGLSQWHNGRWIVALNANEPEVRQHFSLAHELFHIINHTTRQWLHPGNDDISAYDQGEHLADYFAGCLLMPKRHVKSLHGWGLKPDELAEAFDVSLRAMNVRLQQLGLTEPLPRCVWPVNSYRRVVKPYLRPVPESEGAAA
jgi:predicted transcriptional regulator